MDKEAVFALSACAMTERKKSGGDFWSPPFLLMEMPADEPTER
jgi:hypothetical protein